MEKKLYVAGHNFDFFGSSYQITDISYGAVRYAATKGGKVFRVSKENFDEITTHEKFSWDQANIPIDVDATKIQKRSRRKLYVTIAIRELYDPLNRNSLHRLIPVIATEIHDDTPPCAKTVVRWIKKFQSSNDQGLNNQRIQGNITFRYDPIIEQLILEGIEKIYLQKERRTAIDVESYVIGRLIESGLMTTTNGTVKIPTRRTIQRRIAQLDPYVVVKARQGEFAAQKYARSSGRTLRSYTALTIVQIDTHVLDVLVVDEVTGEPIGRPYLIVILDITTRMIVGYYLSLFPPSATTALAALKYMLIHFGIPAQIIPDNGVELKNTAFSRVCCALYISIIRAQVRDPNGKAHIESFFRSLTYAITQKIPGTTFSNPTQRGAYNSKSTACFTVEKLNSFIHEWIYDVYHKSVHSTTGRAPALAWADETKTLPPTVLSEAEVQVLVRQPYRRTVHNGMIVFEHLDYTSHALVAIEGEQVVVLVDELNLSHVYVEHPRDKDVKILAESTDVEYTRGLTIYEHREALKIRKEMSKKDVETIGKFTLAYARYLLLERINQGTMIAKKWLKSIASQKLALSSTETHAPEEYSAIPLATAAEAYPIPETDSGDEIEFPSIKLSMDK